MIGVFAGVENRVAVQRFELAGRLHAHAAVARIDRAGRRLQREPAFTLDRDIERIVGLDQRPSVRVM